MLNVLVSLTTTSMRINKINKTILSLMSQSYPIHSINLYISKTPYLIDKGIQSIPNNLQLLMSVDKRFKIFFVENLGSYRKLLPILKTNWNKDCLILTVDDDKIYSFDMVEKMINKYIETNGKFIIANRAFIKMNSIIKNICIDMLDIEPSLCDKLTNHSKKDSQNLAYELGKEFDFISILTFFEGNDGVLYHPKFFSPTVYNWKLINKIALTHDDFWFKICALINGIGVICINDFNSRNSKQIKGTNISALHFNINKGSYDIYFNNIIRWFYKNGHLKKGIDLFKINNNI